MKILSEKRRKLLQLLEPIVGKHCYNESIQNYEGRDMVSEGRDFRYPVQFSSGTQVGKTKLRRYRTDSSYTLTGHYRFGQNELYIMRALDEVIEFLENNFGLAIENGPEMPDGDIPVSFEQGSFLVKVTKSGVLFKAPGGGWQKKKQSKP